MQNINRKIEETDHKFIYWSKKNTLNFSRFAIFIVYFWFGILKVFGVSPAKTLVVALFTQIPFLNGASPTDFVAIFGMLEITISILFLIPHLERLALFVLTLHLIAIFMPLILLPNITWQSFLVPTLEGQYIIKNFLLIAVAIDILANLKSHDKNHG